jgi:hypothetical protein
MATVAVFIALGGGAYAATSIVGSGGQIRGCVGEHGNLTVIKPSKGCPKGKSYVAWNQLGPRGKEGAAGRTGASGERGAPGQNGAPGENGAPGSALAFAHVLSDGTLDVANSKNVIDVRPVCGSACASPPPHGAGAGQCFQLTVTPHSAVVSTEILSSETAARVQVPGLLAQGLLPGCAPAYAAAEVFTFNTTTGVATAAGFYVVFN